MTYWLVALFSLLSLLGFVAGAKSRQEENLKLNRKIAWLLGFSSGLILYTTMGEALPVLGEERNRLFMFFLFFVGMTLNFGLSHLLPDKYDPHEATGPSQQDSKKTVFALSYHAVQETVIVFGVGLYSVPAVILMALAAFLHHIPEATGLSLKEAFLTVLFSAISSAVIFLLICLSKAIHDCTYIISLCAGMAVLMTLDELLPVARNYGQHHTMMGGMVGGMMLASFLLLIAPFVF